MAKEKDKKKSKKAEPIKRFSMGAVTVSAWENKGKTGKYLSFTIQKRYLDDDGDWQTSASYNISDLSAISLLINCALRWYIEKKDQEDSKDSKEDAEDDSEDDSEDDDE